MVSDGAVVDAIGARRVGGLAASMYFLTVFLWMPNTRAIVRMESPRSLAWCAAFHRALCRGVGFLRGDAGVS